MSEKLIFPNPLFEAGDPFLLLHDNKYYMYFTTEKYVNPGASGIAGTDIDGKDGLRVFESEDLINWTDKGYCLNVGDSIGEKWFWAPEVIYHNGKFYMTYTAEEHIAVAVADSPLGPFKQTEKKWLSERKTIDGHFFLDDDGQMYLYYVRLGGGNKIYATKMSDDLMSIDEENEQFLISAEEPWETIDCLVTEGPFVLKHKGLYYLVYSANHTRSHDYAVGYAVSDKPLGPFKKFEGNPILHKNEVALGPGHNSFAKTKDGKGLLCAYHCHFSPEVRKPRMAYIDKAEFVSSPDSENDILVIHGPTRQK